MNIIELNADNFDQVIHDHHFLLIDFWAKWCKPCQTFKTVIDRVAPEYPDFLFARIDIEDQKALADEFEVRSIPSVMILRDNVVVYAESGALSMSVLRDLLDQAKALDENQ